MWTKDMARPLILPPIKWYHLHSIPQYQGRVGEGNGKSSFIKTTLLFLDIRCSMHGELGEHYCLHNSLVLPCVSWSECVASVSVCHPSHYLTRCLYWGDLIRITSHQSKLSSAPYPGGVLCECITHYRALQCASEAGVGWGLATERVVMWAEGRLSLMSLTLRPCHATMSRRMVEERRPGRK